MRLFISINFKHLAMTQLLNVRNTLISHSQSGNFSLPENLHLTLAFLGEYNLRQTEYIKQTMDQITFEPFTITISKVDFWHKGLSDLVFCSLYNDTGYKKLQRLHSDLGIKLSENGFNLEQRNFKAHITLGRNVIWNDDFSFSNFTNSTFLKIQEHVDEIKLMKSERINGKLTYMPIFTKKGVNL